MRVYLTHWGNKALDKTRPFGAFTRANKMQNYILLLIAVTCWLGCSLFVWLLLRHVRRPLDDLGWHDVALVVLVVLGPISVIAGYIRVFWRWIFPHAAKRGTGV